MLEKIHNVISFRVEIYNNSASRRSVVRNRFYPVTIIAAVGWQTSVVYSRFGIQRKQTIANQFHGNWDETGGNDRASIELTFMAFFCRIVGFVRSSRSREIPSDLTYHLTAKTIKQSCGSKTIFLKNI